MLFNCFTVIAQVLNFLMLIWLMKRFLYQPILDAIDARERHIADELADAASRDAAAEDERREFEARTTELAERQAGMLAEAGTAAAAERERLLAEARAAAASDAPARRQALRDEGQRTRARSPNGRQRGVRHLAPGARRPGRGTSKRAPPHLHPAPGPRRLRARAHREALKAAYARAAGAQRVRVAAGAADGDPDAVDATFSAEPSRCTSRRTPELVSGIELSANGQKLAWSIADYLEALVQQAGELLEPAATGAATERRATTPSGRSRTARDTCRRVFDRTPSPARRRPEHSAATGAARGGHGRQRLHRHRAGARPARRGLRGTARFPGGAVRHRLQPRRDGIGVVLLGDHAALQAGDEVAAHRAA